jgi:circadian clock protein KaiC
VQGLRQFLSGRDCTSLFIDDVMPHANEYQYPSLVHGIIRLERYLPVYGGVQRQLVVAKMRGLAFAEGYHDFKITSGDLLVYPHLVAAKHKVTFAQEQVTSGVAELDTLLGGGLNRGQSSLLLGPSGVGKSTVTMQCAMAAASRGERSIVYLFDETVETYIQRGVALGMDIQTQVDAGRMMVNKIDPAARSVGEYTHQICQVVEQEAVRLVIIDSLGGYLHAMSEAKFLSLHLQELLTYLNNRGVITLLIMVQPGFIGPALQTPVELSSIADTILLLRFFETQGRVHKAISVIKRRGGQHETVIRELQLTPRGVQVGAPLETFQGILSGMLQYFGESTALLEK